MIKLKSITLSLLAIANFVSVSAQYGTGLREDRKAESDFPVYKPGALGFAAGLPASYSLRKYTPFVKSQGVYPSCAGWAVSYEALSTQNAIAYGMTNRNLITAKAFCPYYSYNKSNPGDPACKMGSAVIQNMRTIRDEGSKKFYLPLMGCGVALFDEFNYASQYYKINKAWVLDNIWPKSVVFDNNDIKTTFSNFFNTPHTMDFNEFKQLVYQQNPVIISVALPSSFMDLRTELWEPTAEEKADPTAAIMQNTGGHRAHAMTVIGYDDNKYGGAFEVMNSWSESWGDNGYFWVKYEDFKMYVYGAYYMELYPIDAAMATKTGVVWGDCQNGYGLLRGANGESYEGQFTNGKFNGYGVYTWPNGWAYAGQWVDGKRHGEATCYYSDGVFGQVTYANDAFVSGYNELLFTNGDKYKGYLKDGKYHGYGEYTLSTGAKILSMFTDGKMDGLAKVFELDGSTFVGFYSNGQKNGKGLQVSADKKITAGEWVYDVYQKKRTFGFADPKDMKTRSGMSSEMYLAVDCASGNCLTGEGKRITSNGNTYSGTFVDGLEDGKGEMVCPAVTYNGSWRQGRPYGIGEFKYTEGYSCITEVVKGLNEGYVLWFGTTGTMAVSLFKEGVEIAVYKEIFSNTNTTNSGIPSGLKSIPAVVSPLK